MDDGLSVELALFAAGNKNQPAKMGKADESKGRLCPVDNPKTRLFK
jgi:hypothetical protein